MRKLLYFFYFFSGTTALIYEVVWARRLGLIFGVDAQGVATVLSVFFMGLAMGAFLFGKLNPKNALRTYGILELVIGIYAAFTPIIFRLLFQFQATLLANLGNPQFFSFSLTVFLLSILFLILPTTLMGATFPVISKTVITDERKIGEGVGLLYGLNTLGAVVGTFLAGFLLVWFLGMNATTWLAAIVNLGIGGAVIYLSSKFKVPADAKALAGKQNSKFQDANTKYQIPNTKYRFLLVVFFLTGFAALALEVLWTRVLVLTFGASTYAFATVLAVFLFGIAAGSLVASWLVARRLNLNFWFSLSLLILGILVIILTPFLGNLPNLMVGFLNPASSSYLQIIIASFVLGFFVLIIPTILMGINFVIGVKIYLKNLQNLGKDVGSLYGINTFGGVIGAFAAGFILLPLIGIQKSIVVAALAYFLTAILVGFYFFSERKIFRLGVVIISIFIIVVSSLLPSWNKHLLSSGISIYYRDYLEDKGTLEERASRGEILFYKEGLLATVMVKKAPEGYLFLRTNGKTDASTDQDLDDLHLIGHLPMILHQNPKNVLVIGLGSGITLGSIGQHKTDTIDVVEIEEAMVEAAKYFKDYNHNVLSDPRVKIIKADARAYLAKSAQKYDVISSQPSNLWVRGNASLFTKDFFEAAKRSLAQDGLMLQWIPFYSFSDKEFKSALKTLALVFPYVTVWTPVVSQDVLLIGSKNPQEFDFEKVDARVKTEAIQKDLESAAITSGEDLLAHYLFDEKSLKTLIDNALVHTDDKPILEFSAPFSLYQETSAENLSQIMAVKADYAEHFKNLKNADLVDVQRTKEAVNLILGAKFKAAKGNLEEAASDFEQALKITPKDLTKKELSRIYFELARRSYELSDFSRTVFYFEKSVALHPQAQVYLNLSILYLGQNRLAKAGEALEKAKTLEPNNPRIVEVEEAINKAKSRT